MTSANIPSLDFIKKIKTIKNLSLIDTAVASNDIRPLLDTKLTYASIDNKRAYNMKPDELQRMLTERNG